MRDVFPDALRGVALVEEIRDIPIEKDITPAKDPDPALDNKSNTETLAEKLAKEAETAEVVDVDTGEIEQEAEGEAAVAIDPAELANILRGEIDAVTNATEWNDVALKVAEHRDTLGGRYPSIKKKCQDKKESLQKPAEEFKPGEPDMSPIPGMEDNAPPAKEAGDPGF